MQQIEDWLKALGLEEYALRFNENGIDLSVLSDLTDQDLKDLGVLLGHRRKMQRAIAELRGAASVIPQGSPPPVQEAERRQLTVMFCDIVESTALSASMDPEDVREIIAVFQRSVDRDVNRYGGFVAKYMGDGVLVYFGYPQAHEDDAERAVRAALDIIPAMARIKTPTGVRLKVRIGIATGLAVVGDLIGRGAAQEQVVVGDTPNLAARLQALAEPGTVLIAASTRRLLGDWFQLRELGRHQVKGIAEPIESWVVEGRSQAESRFEAERSARLTGFVGREEEIGLLSDLKNLAWQGEGRVVLIAGEAGIGKSRMAAWLVDRIASEPHTKLRYQCSPYHSSSALYPFIAQIERAAEIKPDESPERRLDKLEALLAMGTSNPAAVAPLFATLLSIPFGQSYPPLTLSPAQQRRQTLAAVIDQLEGLAGNGPVLFVFEDSHWADATSLEMLDLTVDRIRHLPVLMIITFRPEFDPAWTGLPHVTTLALGRLDRAYVESMAKQVTGGRQLPAEVMDQIISKTDGVPLFVEELTKTVLESGILVEEADGYCLDGPLPPLAIPTTLHDSLAARLDHLAPVKEIAQVGAVIGRQFSYALLNSVAPRGEAALRDGLAQLEHAQLIQRYGEPPEATYTFKHALVQDAAYEGLLKSRRQILHRRIAEVLCDQYASGAASEPEVIAHHFTRAGITESAVEWWRKAGERALQSSALVEATAHLEKAIGLAEGLPDGADQRLLRLRLQIAYGNGLIARRGYAVRETTAAFARAQELAAGIEDAAEQFSVYFGVWVGRFVRAELEPMREIAEMFLRETESRPKSPEAAVAHRVYGSTCWFEGNYAEAFAHLERAQAAYDAERDRALALRFGQDIGVSAMVFMSLVLLPLALTYRDVDRVREILAEGLAHAVRSEHPQTLAYAHCFAFVFWAMFRDAARAAEYANSLIGLAREHGMQFWLAYGTCQEGWARWQAGDRKDGEKGMREGIALIREQGHFLLPFHEALLAEIEAESGRLESAIAILNSIVEEAERTGQRWYLSEIHRQRGELFMRRDRPDVAASEAELLRAIDIARTQQTRKFELRATLALARLYRAKGTEEKVRALLTATVVAFDGQEFPEITEAKRLLAGTSERP
jgi:class 3 adenylate cyclase/predicted ATPase